MQSCDIGTTIPFLYVYVEELIEQSYRLFVPVRSNESWKLFQQAIFFATPTFIILIWHIAGNQEIFYTNSLNSVLV